MHLLDGVRSIAFPEPSKSDQRVNFQCPEGNRVERDASTLAGLVAGLALPMTHALGVLGRHVRDVGRALVRGY